MKHLYLFLALLSLPLAAQRANDECVDAEPIPETTSYCSGPSAFSNFGATPSFPQNDYPVCFDEVDQIQDVWFSFTALRNSANITVTGNIDGTPGGTLNAPQFALYEGSCGFLVPVGCRSPFQDPDNGQFLNGSNILFNGLTIGDTYFVLVAARNGNTGSFELCIDQFDAVPAPSGDCSTGVILCDKSPFSVQELTGIGQEIDDLLAGNICGGSIPEEANSAWYKWTCDQPGSLDFTIAPLGSAFNEDIDFVLFELPSGIDNCDDKVALRRMFSGETRGQGAANLPCLGETGLSTAETETFEECGCGPGDNNFVATIDMVAGRSYALVIMNFSSSGDGFAIEWRGDGTFLGPEPNFTFSESQVCVGDALVFADQSQSVDPIVSREWDFGPTASPQTASGPGPHSVVFGQAGQPAVSLTIETSRSCREVLNQQEVNVICCDGQFAGSATITNVICPTDSNGVIDFTGSSNFSPATVTYSWSNGEITEDLDDLTQGQYFVTISDASGCEDVLDFNVGGPRPFTFDTLITMPDCAGGTNGALTFTVTGGGAGPYVYNLNNAGFGPGNSLQNLPVSVINVVARDVNGCLVEQDIPVNELELGLVDGARVAQEPVCAGDANGVITIELANGRPAYQYDFGLGNGFQNNNTQGGLPQGNYTITARDADGCLGIFPVDVLDPPVIILDNAETDISCFGADDGQIITLRAGGRPGYTFSWSDGSMADSIRTGLEAGVYTVSLTDQNGCVRTLTDTIIEPSEIFPILEESFDLACFEEATGAFRMSATGGTPAYTYSADGTTFQADPLLENLFAGSYRLFVQDANGCLDSLEGTLNQPDAFIVDPGSDLRIVLGFDTVLQAVSNYDPVTYVWGPDTLACLDPPCTRVRAAPVARTLYTVIGTNAAGCRDTAQVEVAVTEDRPLYVPNAFSPDGNGTNDGFTVFGGPAVERINALRVYDRWGGLVFERDDFRPNEPSLGWDGTVDGRPVNAAVFVYYASVRYINGSTLEFQGDVTVVR